MFSLYTSASVKLVELPVAVSRRQSLSGGPARTCPTVRLGDAHRPIGASLPVCHRRRVV